MLNREEVKRWRALLVVMRIWCGDVVWSRLTSFAFRHGREDCRHAARQKGATVCWLSAMRTGVKMAIGGGLCLLLSSCAVIDWFAGKTSDREVSDMDREIAKSVTSRTTAYDAALHKFGKMLEAYNIEPTRVQSKIISNQTAEKGLPDDVSRMLISSINKIGHRVIYVPYDPNYVLNEANTGGEIHRALPKIVIAGGITEFDKGLIEKSRELKSEVSIQRGDFGSRYSHDGGTGYQAESAISRITLDLQLLDYKTQTYLSGIQAINSVNIRKTKLGWGVGYFFQGSGMSFQYSLRKKQGKYYALRLLVELSVLETLGKYFDVPYWRCIAGMPPDRAMIERLRDEFDNLSDARRYSYLKEYLFLHGIDGFNRESNRMTAAELAKLEQIKKRYHCHDDTALFLKLWETVPIPQAIKRNREYRRRQQRRAELAAIKRRQKIARYNRLITQADDSYRRGQLRRARELYRQASGIFPEQRDPLEMMARIDRELAAAAKVTVKPVETPVQRASRMNTASVPAQAGRKRHKEVPLNPFKTVEW